MYWSRKFKISDCITEKKCDYIGIPKNDERHSISYNLSNCTGGCDKIRKNPRVRNNKEEMEALRKLGVFNDVYKNRAKVDGNNDSNIRCNRSLVHVYKRNQPAPRGKNGNDNKYSYSYNEFLRIKKMTYDKRLPTKEPKDNTFKTGGYGGSNCENDNCNSKNLSVIWKPNNKKYGVQGAVSSSSRLDRLKLDTIRGSKKCENDNTK